MGKIELSDTTKIRIRLSLVLTLQILDLATDGFTLSVYWKIRDGSQWLDVAILSSISFGLGVIIFIGHAITIIDCLRDGKIDAKDDFVLMLFKNLETVFEAIPQLWINLYVLSFCFDHDAILYASAALSFISVFHGMVGLDSKIWANDDNIDELNLDDSEAKKFKLFDHIFVYASRGLSLVARILLLTYLVYYVGWWTVLFIVLHWVLMAMLIAVHMTREDTDDEEETFTLRKLASNIPHGVLIGAFYVFTYFVGKNLLYDMFFLSIFMIENSIALMVSYSQYSETLAYCLYSNVVAVHVSVNIASMVVLLVYAALKRFVIVD